MTKRHLVPRDEHKYALGQLVIDDWDNESRKGACVFKIMSYRTTIIEPKYTTSTLCGRIHGSSYENDLVLLDFTDPNMVGDLCEHCRSSWEFVEENIEIKVREQYVDNNR